MNGSNHPSLFRPKFSGALIYAVSALALTGGWPALAQTARPPAARPAPAAAPAQAPGPVSAEPQRTTASFGDWVLRCERTLPDTQTCEAVQVVSNQQGQPVAQIALGHPARTEPMRMTMLVPPSVTLAAEPKLTAAPGDKPAPGIDLGWRRCLPAGCIADATVPAGALAQLRSRTEPSRLVFQDGAAREASLPFSPRGLAQALDALAKEEGR